MTYNIFYKSNKAATWKSKARSYTFMAAALLSGSLFTLSSCSEWLDVKPLTEEREKDLFTTYQGFKDALSGCYSDLAGANLYGERLTMADIENLACLWAEPDQTGLPAQYYLWHHQYDNTYSEAALKSIYGGLYNVVAQANKIIEHVGTDGSAIKSTDARNVIEGEAYALRAFCQMDVLRLFGQMPQGAVKQVSLPYALKAGINDIAAYYSYSDYVKLLEQDLDHAEQLLAQSDNDALEDDDFFQYRQFRLNYQAVRALKARLYLYTGQTEKAHQLAMDIIENSGKSLSGLTDIPNGYYTLPGETLFGLSNRSLADYAHSLLGGDNSIQVDRSSMLYVDEMSLDWMIYWGVNTASDNRYLYTWNHNTVDAMGNRYPTLRKYYYDTNAYSSASDLSTLLTKIQVMPIIRLSEIYLIAMETTTDLNEANQLWKTYMASHNVNVTDDFYSLGEVQYNIVDEYRREFFGEGVMFYVY
ncbi:MAG: RagB/SusD family nutrient uptake outer membrane protein, partial [Prevotella sp.]|nr:RagB/SusD family nutrient uptake outer membrane protein [Prevotella sp.]